MSMSTPPPPAFNPNGTNAAPPGAPQSQNFGNDFGGRLKYANAIRDYQDTSKNSAAQGNYIGAAQAQATQSQQFTGQQTTANRPDQNTAFGFSNWHQNPDGTWAQQTGFNGPLQGAVQGLQAQAAQNAGQPFDNGSAARTQAIQSAYDASSSRLNPQFSREQEQLQSQLANQGLDPTSAAYRSAMSQFGQQKNDAYQGAMNSAIGQGTAAQQATFGENLQAQMAPYQQMEALYGLGGAPSFMGAGAATPANLLAAVSGYGNYQLGQDQANAQMWGSALGGLGSAVGAGAGLALARSDERVKQNIQRLPVDAIPGVPLALFEYRSHPGQQYAGVIAQDLEKVAPDHVTEGPDGIKRVSPAFTPFSFGGSK